jgi:hypothetical protein
MADGRDVTTADIAAGGTRETEEGGSQPSGTDEGGDRLTEPLFSPEDAERYRGRWTGVQGDFVDQPREAVKEADGLVAELMQSLAAQFSETRAKLERQWSASDDVSTEDLRVAMTRYRSFFERLLSA